MPRLPIFLGLFLAITFNFAHAETIEGKNFEPEITVAGKKLVLNGTAIKKVERFGIQFKVYVGGLYVSKKTTSGDELMKSADVKVLKMIYLRNVPGKDIGEAYNDNHGIICKMGEERCSASKKELKKMTGNFSDMRTDGTVDLFFYPDKVDFEIKGRKEQNGSMVGTDIATNLLGMYLAEKPIDATVKAGLMGTGK